MRLKCPTLAWAFLFSIAAHVALLMLPAWFGAGEQNLLELSAPESRATLLPSRLVSKAAMSFDAEGRNKSSRQDKTARTTVAQPNLNGEAMASGRLLWLADELDSAPEIVSEPLLEPEYGFADDIDGRVVLSLLLGRDGSVVWVGVESSAVDQATTDYLVRAFGAVEFVTPRFRGKSVFALMRVEVNVSRSLNEPAQGRVGNN